MGETVTDRIGGSEARLRFLLRLSDALRPLSDVADIVGEASRLLAEHLGADRAYFVDVDLTAGTARIERDFVRGGATSLAGEHPVSDFQWSVDILRRGECHVVEDTQTSSVVPVDERPAAAELGIISCMGAPVIKGGTLVGALCVAGAQPREWSADEVDLLRDVGDRIWSTIERARAELAQRRSEQKYRDLFEGIDAGFCVVEVRFDGADGRIDYRVIEANPAFYENTGFPKSILGDWLREAAPDLEEHWFETYGRVARTGEPVRFENQSEMLGRWFDVYAFRTGVPDAGLVAILFKDITERKRHERERELLMYELNHRVKNMLAVITSIGRQTQRNSSNMDEFVAQFNERIRSMSRAHEMLTQTHWEGADLRDQVEQTIQHFAPESENRIEISGESLFIRPNATLALSMALHELATNALKHGAWSQAEGKVLISWTTSDDGTTVLSWQEIGGPKVEPPEHSGFGMNLLQRGLARDLRGDVTVDYDRDGLKCRIEFVSGGEGGEARAEDSDRRG